MHLSESELLSLFVKRYTEMQGKQRNDRRDFKPVEEALDAFVAKFKEINSTRYI